MTITVSVTKDVTDLSVTDTETSLTINPTTIELGVVNVAFSQASSADAISSDATGHITATTVQGALDEIGADPQFTSTLKNKLDGVQAQANKLTAGTNVNISEGAINADVLGALQAGNNISITDAGVISASAVSLTDVYTADDETEHLALDPTPNQGDVVIRTDENKTYIHNGGTEGTMADYTELAQSSGVNSVNDYTGVVTLASTDLSDYAANQYIDWTVEQASDIHSSNISATTYYAGDNITITTSDGLQYINAPEPARLELDSNSLNINGFQLTDNILYTLEVNHDYLLGQDNSGLTFDSPHTIGQSPTPKKITIEGINQDQLSGGGGIIIYTTDEEADTTVPLLLINEASFQFSPNIVQMRLPELVIVGNNIFLTTGTSGNRKIKLHDNVWTETAEIGTSDTGLATTEFVANALALTGGGTDIPAGSGHEKFVTQDESGVFRNRDLNVSNIFTQNVNGATLRLHNDTTDTTAGTTTQIIAGQSISLTTDSNGDLTISSNPDGLPTQSALTDGYVLTSDGADANWVDLSTASLPTQTDNSGKFLTTNGTSANWAEVDVLPSRTGNDGKFLTVENEVLSWADVDALPEQSEDTNGKFLSSNGVTDSWTLPDSTIPTQDTHTGKFLTTDGSQLSWSTINTAGTTGDISFSQSTMTSSGDTVTVDDDLTTTGTLDAQQLDITGAGQPQITSASTFNIVAPEGVYANGNLIIGTANAKPVLFTNIYVIDGSNTQTTSIGGVDSVYIVNGDSQYLRLRLIDTHTTWSDIDDVFVACSYQETQNINNNYENRVDTRVVRDSNYIYIYFYQGAGQEGTDSFSPNGKLKVDIYEA